MTPASARDLLVEDLLFVVGLRREAQILGRGRRILVGAVGLEAALAERRASGLVSFGLCGALDPLLRCGDLVLASEIMDTGGVTGADAAIGDLLAAKLPGARRGRMFGSDAIVGGAAGKAALAHSTGALAVDMESHLVARTAMRTGLPFAVLRAVSDSARDSLPKAAQAGFRPDGAVDVAAVLFGLARRPWETPALVATARGAGAAFKALEHAARSLPR